MGQISSKLRQGEGLLTYWCQGCDEPHLIRVPGWTWDGNVEAPTFSPSVLVRGGHYLHGETPGQCYCDAAERGIKTHFKCRRCHTFIRGGMVEFLSDCSHALAGQTLPLPDLPQHLRDG